MTKLEIAGKPHTLVQDAAHLYVDGSLSQLHWTRLDAHTWQAQVNGKTWRLLLLKHDVEQSRVLVALNGKQVAVAYETLGQQLLKSIGIDPAASFVVKELKAPMPGLIKQLLVQPGATVEKGDPLLILEAMKMENVIKSPTAGTLAALPVVQGQAVEKNQVLVTFA